MTHNQYSLKANISNTILHAYKDFLRKQKMQYIFDSVHDGPCIGRIFSSGNYISHSDVCGKRIQNELMSKINVYTNVEQMTSIHMYKYEAPDYNADVHALVYFDSDFTNHIISPEDNERIIDVINSDFSRYSIEIHYGDNVLIEDVRRKLISDDYLKWRSINTYIAGKPRLTIGFGWYGLKAQYQ